MPNVEKNWTPPRRFELLELKRRNYLIALAGGGISGVVGVVRWVRGQDSPQAGFCL